ncbi:MAG: hypothetical protein Kow0029_00980 [Candidatus Rifleibacteriota bacterium]
MKKATAFLSLLCLLAVLGGSIYLVKFCPDQNLCEPLFKDIERLIQEQYRSPFLIAVIILWLSGFLTALMALFESKPGAVEENIEVKKEEPIEQPSVEESKPETVLKSDYDAKIKALEEAHKKIAELETVVDGLKAQLEKFTVTEEDKSRSAEFEAENEKLNSELESLKVKLNEAQSKLSEAEKSNKKLNTEIEALTAKIEKTEEELKALKENHEKTKTELKAVRKESEKKIEELVSLKEENEKLRTELQAAIADAKSGKNGIPPAAYQILYLFQKEGRLIDLLMEDISDFDDETLGGAIRPIHEGCRKLLKDRLIIEPVIDEEEGSEITLEEIDPEAIKLLGNVPSKGPYKGELVHRGWRLKECHLPELVDGWTGNVVAPAEIEIN